MATKLLLSDPGKFPLAGPEKGKRVYDGISQYVSPYGSYRYVRYVDGVAVSALQVMSRDGIAGQAANVYTKPEFRRKGYAAELWKHARRNFRSLVQAPEKDRTQDGMAWTKFVRSSTMSLYSRVVKLAHENPDLQADLLPLLRVAKVPKIKGAEKELVARKFKSEIDAHKQKIKDAEAKKSQAASVEKGLRGVHDGLRWKGGLKSKGASRDAMTMLMGLGDSLKEEVPEIYDKLKQPWKDYRAAIGNKHDKNYALDQVYKAFKKIPEDVTQKIHDWYNNSNEVVREVGLLQDTLRAATKSVNSMLKHGLISKDQKKQFKKDFEIDQQGTRGAFNREMKGERVEYKGKRMNFTSLPKDERQRIFDEDWFPEKKKELQVLHDEKGAAATAKKDQKKKERAEKSKAKRDQKKKEKAEQAAKAKSEEESQPKPKEKPEVNEEVEAPAKDRKELMKTEVPNPDYGKKPGAKKDVTLNTIKRREEQGEAPKGFFKKIWDKLMGKKAAQEAPMIRAITKLAHSNPGLRPALLPIIAQHSLMKLALRGSTTILSQLVKFGYVGPAQLYKMVADLEEGIRYWRGSGAASEADAGLTALKGLKKEIKKIEGAIDKMPTTKDDRGKKITQKRFLAEHGDDKVKVKGKKTPTKIKNLRRTPDGKKEFDKQWAKWRKQEEKARDKARGKTARKKTPSKPLKFASSGDLKTDLVKLAYANPELRPHLLPILASFFNKTPKSIGDFKLIQKGDKGKVQEMTWTHKDDSSHTITLKVTPGKTHSSFSLKEKTPGGRTKDLGHERRPNAEAESVLSDYVGKAHKTVDSAEADRGGWASYIKKTEFKNPKYDARKPGSKKKVKFNSLSLVDQKKERSKWDRGMMRAAAGAAAKMKKQLKEMEDVAKKWKHLGREDLPSGMSDLPEIIRDLKKDLGQVSRLKGRELDELIDDFEHFHKDTLEGHQKLESKQKETEKEKAKQKKEDEEAEKDIDLDREVPSPHNPALKIKLRTLRDEYPERFKKYLRRASQKKNTQARGH